MLFFFSILMNRFTSLVGRCSEGAGMFNSALYPFGAAARRLFYASPFVGTCAAVKGDLVQSPPPPPTLPPRAYLSRRPLDLPPEGLPTEPPYVLALASLMTTALP